MGYILPITNYKYEHYHRRMVNQKKSPHIVEKLYKMGRVNNNPHQDSMYPFYKKKGRRINLRI